MNRSTSRCTGYDPTALSRRQMLSQFGYGIGSIALSQLLMGESAAALSPGVITTPHVTPKAKRIIFLLQSGAPSQMDLYDYKPLLNELNGQELPDSVRQGQ